MMLSKAARVAMCWLADLVMIRWWAAAVLTRLFLRMTGVRMNSPQLCSTGDWTG